MPKVLVIGLDGATFRLIRPLVASGEMPELTRFMERGCWGQLNSTFPPLTPPSWSSFMTGKNPGKHGVMGFRGAPKGYDAGDFVSSNTLRARTLWDIVGEAGRPVGALHVVPSYPLRPVNGFMVSCMLSPPGAKDIIYPPELRPLLGDDYVIHFDPPKQFDTDDPDYRSLALGYIAALRRLGQRNLDATLRLMQEKPCDLLTVILYEVDRLQHRFWRHLTEAWPQGADPAVLQEIARTARESFRAVDAAVGTLLRAAGPDTVTFIISDHGFGPAPDRFVFVNRWLADHGFLHVRRSWKLRHKVVKKLPERLRMRFDTVENIFVDWSRSRAWSDPMETRSGGVWINVAGRQPQGVVRPGAEYERLRDEIIAGLSPLRDGNRPVFRLVARREDVYHGAMIENFPDIVIHTNPSHGLRFNGMRPELRARSPFTDFKEYGFTGAHEPEGLYMIAGPGVAALGEQGAKPIEAIAPTILCLLGLPVPDGMDAPPLLELLTDEGRANAPLRHEPDREPAAPEGEGTYGEEDRALVEERLRALGYVE